MHQHHILVDRVRHGGGSYTSVLCSLSGAGGQEEELAIWSGSGLVGLPAAMGLLFPPQSKGDHLLGLGVDSPSRAAVEFV